MGDNAVGESGWCVRWGDQGDVLCCAHASKDSQKKGAFAIGTSKFKLEYITGL